MGKKQLLFLYVDDFKGFWHQEFNFSTEDKFHVAQKEESLLLQKNKLDNTLPQGFWASNISNINLIIGENGSGKTTLIHIICQWLCWLSEGKLPQEKGILVFQEENNIKYIAFEKKMKLNIFMNIPYATSLEESELINFFQDLKLLYFSNTMTELNLNNFEILLDYSMPYRIIQANNYGHVVSPNIIPNYKQFEFNKQVDTALNEDINDFPIHYLWMEIQPLNFQEIGYLSNDQNIAQDLSEIWNQYFDINLLKENLLIIELLKALFIGIIKKLIEWETNEVVKENPICIDTIQGIISSTINVNIASIEKINQGFKWVENFLKDLLTDFKRRYKNEIYTNTWEYIEEFVNEMYSYIKQENVDVFLKKSEINSLSQDKKMRMHIEISSKENKLKFQQFWKVYKNIALYMENVNFYWDASSGERNWVSLFSVLVDVPQTYKNIWIFLDEPNNTFHPDWERKFLDKFIETCTYNYKNSIIQAWISTHSPIMLSDMPGNSAIYLKEKKNIDYPNKNTFGQNIYVLFNNAFFLKDGVIGTFSSKKILEVLRQLESMENDLYNGKELPKDRIEGCKKIIDLIAEPLFKNQMQGYLAKFDELIRRTDDI